MRQRIEPHDKRDDANGQVNEKDALPGKACHQHATEHGATHHAEGHEGRENTHSTTAFARRKRLGDDTHVVGHGRRATDALNNARQNKNLERGRKATKQRANRKDDDTQLEHAHLAAHIAQAAKRQHSHACRKQVHRTHQLNAIEAHAQFLLHHGQRHGHDGRIQAHHKRHDEHGKQNRPLVLAMGVALKGKVLAAQLLCGFLHIHPFEWRNAKKRGPNRLQTAAIGVPPTESERKVTEAFCQHRRLARTLA